MEEVIKTSKITPFRPSSILEAAGMLFWVLQGVVETETLPCFGPWN